MTIKQLSRARFEALAGYTRDPIILALVREIEWIATEDERVLGILTHDQIDGDFGWVALGRDERLRYRAIDVNHSFPSSAEARADLVANILSLGGQPDHAFRQGDASGDPVDFFRPMVPYDQMHPSFKLLLEDRLYSPAREMIAALMRYHVDADGNFIQQFQTTGFDARIWELYLYCTFTEAGFCGAPGIQVPDFVLRGPFGEFCVEATTANPTQGVPPRPLPANDQLGHYIENYVPIKLARALKKKLNRSVPYWSLPQTQGLPFVIAVQDFHAEAAMSMIVPAATEYVFGIRHTLIDGRINIQRIADHRFENLVEASGFFRLQNSEHVSAVIVNPQGTLAKFNRLGYIAGFGDRRVRMVRHGLRRNDADPVNPMPIAFVEEVHSRGYAEQWIEGMVVLHNPGAAIPLNPGLLPGATHEFLQEDGRIMSALAPVPTYTSRTMTSFDDR